MHLWNFPHVQLFFFTFFSTSYHFCSSWYRLMSTLLLPLGFKIDPLYSILPIAIFSYVLPEIQYNGVSSPKAQESLFLRLYLLIFRFALMPSMLLWFIRPSLPLIESLHAPLPSLEHKVCDILNICDIFGDWFVWFPVAIFGILTFWCL